MHPLCPSKAREPLVFELDLIHTLAFAGLALFL
jgi:hypothetical protein